MVPTLGHCGRARWAGARRQAVAVAACSEQSACNCNGLQVAMPPPRPAPPFPSGTPTLAADKAALRNFLTQNLLGAAVADAASAAQPPDGQAHPVSSARAAANRAAALADALAAIQSTHSVDRSSLMGGPVPEGPSHPAPQCSGEVASDAADLAAPPAELDDSSSQGTRHASAETGAAAAGATSEAPISAVEAPDKADCLPADPPSPSGSLPRPDSRADGPVSALKGAQPAGAVQHGAKPSAGRRVAFGDESGQARSLRLRAPAAEQGDPSAGEGSSNAPTEPGDPAARERADAVATTVPQVLAALQMSRFEGMLAEAGVTTMSALVAAAQDPPRLLAAGLPAAAARRLAAAGRRIQGGVYRVAGGADGPGSPTEVSMGLQSPTPPPTSLPPAPSRYRAGDASPPRPGQPNADTTSSASMPDASTSAVPTPAASTTAASSAAKTVGDAGHNTGRAVIGSVADPRLPSMATHPLPSGFDRSAGCEPSTAPVPAPSSSDGASQQAAPAAPALPLQAEAAPPSADLPGTSALDPVSPATPATIAAGGITPAVGAPSPAGGSIVAAQPAPAAAAPGPGAASIDASLVGTGSDGQGPAPSDVREAVPQEDVAPPLWEEFASADGYVYFHRRDTGETQWERPAGVTVLSLEQKARSRAARQPVAKPSSGPASAVGSDLGAESSGAPRTSTGSADRADSLQATEHVGQGSRATAPQLLQLQSPAADWRTTRLRARNNVGSALAQPEFKSERQRWRDAWQDVIAPTPTDSLSAPGSPKSEALPVSPPAGSGSGGHSLSGADTTAAASPCSSPPLSPAIAPLPAPPLRFLQSQSARLRGDEPTPAATDQSPTSPATNPGPGEPVADIVSRALALAAKARAAASSVPPARGSQPVLGKPLGFASAQDGQRGRDPLPVPALSSWSRSPSPQRGSRASASSGASVKPPAAGGAAPGAAGNGAAQPKPADSWRLSGATITPAWRARVGSAPSEQRTGMGSASPDGRVTVNSTAPSPARGTPTSPQHMPARFRKPGAAAPVPAAATPESPPAGSADTSQQAHAAQRPSLASFESPDSRRGTKPPARAVSAAPRAPEVAAARAPVLALDAPALGAGAQLSVGGVQGLDGAGPPAGGRVPGLRRAGSSFRVKSYSARQPDGWAAPRPSTPAEGPLASAEMVGMRRAEAAFATSLRGGDSPAGARRPGQGEGSGAGLARSSSFVAMRVGMDSAAPTASVTGSYAYGHQAAAARAAGSGSVFDRLTDTRGYTGTHKHRFDSGGRGRGLRGRDSTDIDYEWVKSNSLAASGAPVFTTNDAGSLAFGVRRLQ